LLTVVAATCGRLYLRQHCLAPLAGSRKRRAGRAGVGWPPLVGYATLRALPRLSFKADFLIPHYLSWAPALAQAGRAPSGPASARCLDGHLSWST